MSRTAYRVLPKLQTAAPELDAPERGYGVEIPSLAGVGVAVVLGALASFCLFLLIGLERSGSSPSVILWGSFSLIAVLCLGYLSIRLRTLLPERRTALARRGLNRRAYLDEKLIPFAAAHYGLTELADPLALLRGEPSEATLGERKLNVILLEEDGPYGFGEHDESRLETDDEARRSGGADAPVYLFPYSMEEHSSSGDGSLHSTDDGGGYGDSGGDGGAAMAEAAGTDRRR